MAFTVSGTAGNWIYDFSVTNNLGDTNAIYFVGVRLGAADIVASPSLWDPNAIPSWNNSLYGGSNINYDNIWITGPTSSAVIAPGQTKSGFEVGSTDSTPLSGVSWFAYSAGGHYTGPGCSANCGAPFDNPGFEGTALVAVPDPSTVWLLGAGFMGLAAANRTRRSAH